jgi:hypothetical protein
VIFVPKDGNPQDALTDFLNDKREAQGRPEACASTRRTPGGRRRRRCDLARQPGDAFQRVETTPCLQARLRAVRLFPRLDKIFFAELIEAATPLRIACRPTTTNLKRGNMLDRRRRTDIRLHAGKEKRGDSRCHAFRPVREEAFRVLRSGPQIPERPVT